MSPHRAPSLGPEAFWSTLGGLCHLLFRYGHAPLESRGWLRFKFTDLVGGILVTSAPGPPLLNMHSGNGLDYPVVLVGVALFGAVKAL